ncbi:MAG: DUF2789 domain-containing protein [Burkholderiaceae bacterium]|nr:DUF2789 domain-containing protein [Roseateles sp.]MBV8469161.1 DUF2789 domain-containing protein [Burkholderiaceae bacterium]
MNAPHHRLEDLFAQLGLASSTQGIEAFLSTHAPIPADVPLADAPFWTEAQSKLLKEEMLGDADWAEVVDQLNLALHQTNA